MYTIGQFSMMTKMSRKTLRYYDEIDLLKPVRVDAVNNYRYYNDSSIFTAQQILIYRSCDISLEVIKELLISSLDKNEMKEILLSQQELIATKIDHMHKAQSELRNIIKSLEENSMKSVRVIRRDRQTVVSIQEKGTHETIGSIISRLYETIAEKKYHVLGPHTIIWRDEKNFDGEDIDMEIYIPVDIQGDQVSGIVKEINAADYCEIKHTGSMATLSSAYKELYSYIEDKALQIAGPFQETYLSNKPFIDPSQMEIIVAVPVKEV